MRLLTRYILREVISYALLGAVLFTFVLFMRDLPKILELVVRDSASLTDVLRIFAYTLPNTLTVTLPTAVLAGILLGLSRLAADSEVTAMRACGIGAFSFVRIVSILPQSVLTRRKVGFDTPVEFWMKEQHSGFLRDVLLSKRAPQRGFWASKDRNLVV